MLRNLFYVILFVGIVIRPQVAYAQKSLEETPQQKVLYMAKGAKIILHGNSNAAAAYQWYKNSVKLQGETAKDIVITEEGIFNVLSFNREGCPSEMSDNIKIAFATSTDVNLSIDMQTNNAKILPGQSFDCQLSAFNKSITDASGVIVSLKISGKFLYQPDPLNPSIDYDQNNQLITWSLDKLNAGSKKTITLNIKAKQPGQLDLLADIRGSQQDPEMGNNTKRLLQQIDALNIPNVFTPNGDGVNDTFAIPGLESFAESEITIANRAGANVFIKKNYKNDWSGENLPEGTYFYLLRIKDNEGSWQVYKSYITLLRSKL
ncbi:gliding motility-associated C-terminal domain-containing protein [Mucilaginibacter conchicola]|uniref:Gliding motility-associated C-terminal domain-containing protein n=1 Tax=Mucilaginibacter conchicola TaxID=2303333 RepID=A0A372NYW8_9SPHI|nr:gliding motility-associated C-terminal domain-containing protein [Mucilaginibacter conchicola]RFZ94859.1 gliding motility-associated C-terminal domain-containing protein [Mucilaginibacter conchicola]